MTGMYDGDKVRKKVKRWCNKTLIEKHTIYNNALTLSLNGTLDDKSYWEIDASLDLIEDELLRRLNKGKK